ncbi:MAG: O-antigen ligase family protein [Sphingomicrobium sp.]
MKERLRNLVVPGYLLLCLLLGGSAQGIWSKAILQIFAVVLIAWAVLFRPTEQLTGASKVFLGLVVLSVLLIILQLVPLPPEVWTKLQGRQAIEIGYSTLGQAPPWLPISVSPYETLATAWTLFPPLAILLGIIRLRAYEERWITGALILGTFLSVLLGAIQTISGSPWHLYEITSPGAVGFFANRNHMGTLLLVAIPFTVALFASNHPQVRKQGHAAAMVAMGVGGFLVVSVGVIINGSLAVIALALPVIVFSALILPAGWRLRRLSLPAAAVALVGALAALTTIPIHADLASGSPSTSVESRQSIWQTTESAIADTFPTGTGLGSFQQVYALYEEPSAVESTYVNHVHNDYLEVTLETGLPGLLIMLFFLLWWTRQAFRVWQAPLSSRFTRAATIASAAILAHSVVDYPLRTAALAAVFATSLGMIVQRPQSRLSEGPSVVRPTRHLSIG